ncbi:TOMM precursor leader peptide-binding protein [Rhizobium jaguaris]|uniref:THIF-type NAD/FAD binding fold domain-containing protein n=1 Tax=Rhizobium jaguaris TaxID=1312183 RepID=A0A387G9C1_9HYPH|nr:TOMM precursor leader peptide-binding protein [Rhizobium jaguaris]AYG64421.1 hypothetical protein CCGE525_37415 [Rhizobium jaguaris]
MVFDVRVRLSDLQWTVTADDGFIIGKKATVLRKIRGSVLLRRIGDALLDRLRGQTIPLVQLRADLCQEFPPAVVEDALRQFHSLQIIEYTEQAEESGPIVDHPFHDYFRSASTDPAIPLDRLRQSRIVVVGGGQLTAAATWELMGSGIGDVSVIPLSDVAGALARACNGWEVVPRVLPLMAFDDPGFGEELRQSDLVVMCADQPLSRLREFPQLNALCLELEKPWLCVALDGDRIDLGPLFVPGDTGCFRCLELREESHLPHRAEYFAFKRNIAAPWMVVNADSPPPALRMAAAMVSLEAVRILSRQSFPSTFQTLVELELSTYNLQTHTLVRVPFCDACGPQNRQPLRRAWSI